MKTLVALILMAALPAAAAQFISVRGSDTMVILLQKLSEQFKKRHSTEIRVSGGGSGFGIASFINGTSDLCMASRRMTESEVRALFSRRAMRPLEVRVALDGVALYVHNANPIRSLTFEQIRGIYNGSIRNWKELGGGDIPITVYTRERGSGSLRFIRQMAFDTGIMRPDVQSLPGTAALVQAVAQDPNGIGFGGIAYDVSSARRVAIQQHGKPAVLPTKQTIEDGSYPLTRYLYLYAPDKPSAQMREFLEWIISPEGQAVVATVGYIPLPKR